VPKTKHSRIVGLMGFIPALTKTFVEPQHLAPIIRRLERARVEPLRLVCSVPPRHFKSETLDHYCAWLLLSDPTTRIIFASYGQRLAERQSKRIRALYQRAGGKIATDNKSATDWRTDHDGGLWATSVGGAVTGMGGDVIIVDDAHKGRAAVESATEREKIYEWFVHDRKTRAKAGASFIVNATRWHVDDLSGRLIARGWESINLPALDSQGTALLPSRFNAERLAEIRDELGAYGFASLYLGVPFARGGSVFQDVRFYDATPESMRTAIGVDLAYSVSKRSDYSVAVVLGEHQGTCFILDVLRLQVAAPDFFNSLEGLSAKYRGAPITGFFGGTEKGVIDVARTRGLPIHMMPAVQDKFSRAQPAAAAWNAGRILLPQSGPPWIDAFVSEVLGFTGVGDKHDDQVDALVGAFARVGGAAAMANSTGNVRPTWIRTKFNWTGGSGFQDWSIKTDSNRIAPQAPGPFAISAKRNKHGW